MIVARDHRHMARALELARRASASSHPNPSVGCVLVRDDEIVGEGFTQRAGGNHAEIEALQSAGERAAGSTAYVTLEPCAHTGRTGPCTDALIEAGVARVVFALEDPNPAVGGRGAARLAAAGIDVESRLLEREAEEINLGYCARHRRGRPWVRCKMAASIDGRTALANGESQWITGPASRRDVHRWRARSSAVMTGIGTVLADDPQLSARAEDLACDVMQPVRIIVDSRLRTPTNAQTLKLPGDVLIFGGAHADGNGAARARALESAGARIERVPADPDCSLAAVVARLGELEVNDVWLEAGPTLAGGMIAAGLVDEFVLYFAPDILGTDARGMFRLPTLRSLDERIRLDIRDVRKIGDDLRLIARPLKS